MVCWKREASVSIASYKVARASFCTLLSAELPTGIAGSSKLNTIMPPLRAPHILPWCNPISKGCATRKTCSFVSGNLSKKCSITLCEQLYPAANSSLSCCFSCSVIIQSSLFCGNVSRGNVFDGALWLKRVWGVLDRVPLMHVPIDARYCVLGCVPVSALVLLPLIHLDAPYCILGFVPMRRPPLTQTRVQPTISRERTTHQRDVFAV